MMYSRSEGGNISEMFFFFFFERPKFSLSQGPEPQVPYMSDLPHTARVQKWSTTVDTKFIQLLDLPSVGSTFD